MKKIISIIGIISLVLVGVFAVESSRVTLTLNLVATNPQFQLVGGYGETTPTTFAGDDVVASESDLLDLDKGITAWFKVNYTKYRWNSEVTINYTVGNLMYGQTDTNIAATVLNSDGTEYDDTNGFKLTDKKAEAGSFGLIKANWKASSETQLDSLSDGDYKASVTVTFSVT
ncbi:MAG: hypothetical protein HUK24_05655 [Sphaerochaetaceae bacterium]|nr:hypothetical protein [Sphaerochaetaceae bacterium]